jgi:hypothetical protein
LGQPDSLSVLAAIDDAVVGLMGSGSTKKLGPEQVSGLWRLLEPNWLRQLGMDGAIRGSFTLPGELLLRDPWIAPDLVIPGVDDYGATFDEHHEILTEWDAHVDGFVAFRQSLRSLSWLG